ncbi:large ribosomal subunit protein uL30m [Culicoides brevitarsis]|uniref:large ribosomal subunit protein uL30m n=1 Tax=Culicoides brevitarsis TaxID=469753 RepID=UPI00307CC093
MLRQLLNVRSTLQTTQVRTLTNHKHNKKYIYKDGVKYNNIYYYPRTPDHVDPPIEPAKLFRVERIKPLKGNPHWEKRILRDLGLFEGGAIAIVKNIPENNARLWKVKHLIHITPITFPHGEPTAEDINYTFLKENGECIVAKKLEVPAERIEAAEKFENDPKRLDKETVQRDLRLKWLSGWKTPI